MNTAQLKITQKLSEYEYGAELRLLRDFPNQNKWNYQNLDQYYQTFLGRPILIAYVNGKIGLGHEMKERVDANGEKYYSFTDGTSERIIGALSENPDDIWLEKEGEYTWIVARGKLFTFYAREAVEAIAKKGFYELSVETEVYDSYMEGDIEVFTEWRALGVTLLGEGVQPAVPGANIKLLQALESEFKAACLKAASYRSQSEDDDPNEPGDEPDDTDDDEEPGEDENDIGDSEDDGPDTTQKAANQNLSKGDRAMKLFTTRQLKDIAPTFDGYSVMAGGQDDNGYHFCLLSEDGATAVYTMSALDEVLDAKKITPFGAKVSYAFDEANIDVELDAMTDGLISSVKTASAKVESLSSELKAANAIIETMKAAEMKRRLKAAKAAAIATLEKFNANRDEKVDIAVLESINEKIDAGEYTECVDGEGEWCGEEKVCNDVLARCAEKVIEFDKAHVARNSTHYIWESGSKSDEATSDVSALINRWKSKGTK